MKVNQIITEGLSPILYHVTSPKNLVNIVTNDSFLLTTSIGTGAERNTGQVTKDNRTFKVGDKVKVSKTRYNDEYVGVIVSADDDDPEYFRVKDQDGYKTHHGIQDLSHYTPPEHNKNRKQKIFYMSFSRSKEGDYNRASKYTSSQATIIADGMKLMADGFSGNAVDYWGSGWNKNEMEDRVFSKKDHIPNAHKYIKELHILIPKEDDKNIGMYDNYARKIKLWSKKMGIPCYVYDNVDDYKQLNKNEVTRKLNSKDEKRNEYFRGDRGYFDRYTELLYKDDYDQLGRKAKDFLRNVMYYSDAITSLKADVHNARTSSERPNLIKFIKHMKKFKINDLEEYIEYIKDKFDETKKG